MSNCHTVFHMCWLSLGYLKFLSAPWLVSLLSILFPMLISFQINDFCYFVSCWQYALEMHEKETEPNSKQSLRVQLNDKRFEYLCNAMQWQKKNTVEKERKKMYLNCIYVHIRIYIFHEFVLEHALGNRINVYCPSQSCRHQTIKWRNWAKTENKVPNSVWTEKKREKMNEKKKKLQNYQRNLSCRSINHDFNRTEMLLCVCSFIFFHSLFSWFSFLFARSKTNHVRPACVRARSAHVCNTKTFNFKLLEFSL